MSEQYSITETEAKQLLHDYASNKCCANTKPLENIHINCIEIKNAYLYQIESFTETRDTEWKSIPYLGGVVDDIQYGAIPPIWAIQVMTPYSFVNDSRSYNVPHSEKVELCSICIGIGKITCNSCDGRGGTRNTTGSDQSRQWRECSWCNGSGRVRCTKCSGTGKVVCFLELYVKWKTYANECVVNELMDKFPNKEVSNAVSNEKGFTIMNEIAPKITPLYDYPDLRVKESSIGLFEYMNVQHETQCSRILMQRQILNAIKIAVVFYNYESKDGVFFIYGNNKTVYFPDYPGNYCCGNCCAIL